MIDKSKLPYRKAVTGFVIDKNNNFLLVQNMMYEDFHWAAPGGGVDEKEVPEKAMLRELEEELGTDNFVIISKSKSLYRYDWPDVLIERNKNKWRGPERIQYLVKFTGERDEIKPAKGEIKNIKWVPLSSLREYLVFKDQWKNAEKVLKEFRLM